MAQSPLPPGSGTPTGPGALRPSDERTWAVLAHALPPATALITVFTLGFLPPLVIWLVLRDRSLFVADQGKEALNFQITMLIGYLLGWLTTPFLVGFVIIGVVWILTITFGIIAALAASRHQAYRYPIAARLVR